MDGIYHFPRDLEQIISDHVREDGGAESPGRIAEAIRHLSDLFNGLVAWDARYSRDPGLRHAYLRYFLPVNLPKIDRPLRRWRAAVAPRLAGRPLRALDLGCGPGTSLLGLCDFVRNLPDAERPSALDLVGADLSPENLDDAESLLLACASSIPEVPPLRFQPLRLDLFADRAALLPLTRAGGRFDLVIAANVLCELVRESPQGLERAIALVRAVTTEVLAPGGAIILIEPGLRETARDLHRLRDRLVGDGSLHALAPCLHQEGCPALATARDWCIADLAWEPPASVADLDRRTGLRKGSLKFSYLVLAPERPATPDDRVWRVVSDVLDLKGERRFYLCAKGRWVTVSQLKRERGPNDEVIRSLRRGDLVSVEALESRGAIFRIPANARIVRLEEDLTRPG